MPQTNERLLYRVSGQLPRGFQGHISYTTLLPGELRALRVVFTFDKREPQQEPDTLRAGCMAAAAQNLRRRWRNIFARCPRAKSTSRCF